MLARYPQSLVLLVEDIVAAHDDASILSWMETRNRELQTHTDVPHALVYTSPKSSGTMAKPRFLSVFEVADPEAALAFLARPHAHDALRPLASASYELLEGLPRASESKASGGLLVGLTNCTDPEQRAGFNDWYDQVHAADVIRSPWYWNAQRYRRLEGDLPEYAALYETSLGGKEAFGQYMRWPERNPQMHPCIANVHVWTFESTAAER